MKQKNLIDKKNKYVNLVSKHDFGVKYFKIILLLLTTNKYNYLVL